MPKFHKNNAKVKSYVYVNGKKRLHSRYKLSTAIKKVLVEKEEKSDVTPNNLHNDNHCSEFDADIHSSTTFLVSGEVTEKACSSYATIKEKELEFWEEVNTDILNSYFAKYKDIKEKGVCDVCLKDIGSVVHCKECGAFSSFCHQCAIDSHKDKPYHLPYHINDDYTTTNVYFDRKLYDPHTASCETSSFRILTVVSDIGDVHNIKIWFCGCYTQFETLLRLNLWPATPKQPGSAISIDLLHNFISLQLEGKISFTSFCDGLAWKSGRYNKDLRSCLTKFMKTDSVDQFRSFRRQLVHPNQIVPSYNGFSKCSACPKENGSEHLCVDGNFGLVLKKSASKSEKTTVRSDFFLPDDQVDLFIEEYDETSKDKDCSNFQASTNLRSKGKGDKLSVTGVFGASCRHEFPQLFLNMRHGERLGYIVIIMNELLKRNIDKTIKTHIIYDIACILKRHLEKKGTLTNYPDFKFGIPVFHSYGHKGDCQVENSIRRLDGFGLMDGELMERLWSFLRPFSKITKEMTSAHRTDMLSDALRHFGAIKMENIGSSLTSLLKKAQETEAFCKTELENLSVGISVDLNTELLKSWKNEEDLQISSRSKSKHKEKDWKTIYFGNLKGFYNEKSLALTSPQLLDVAKHTKKANMLVRKLKAVEKKRSFKRWAKNSDEFKEFNVAFLKERTSDTLEQTFSQAAERGYLLNLKRKYAVGSSIANRLSKQINKVCKTIESLVASYNSYGQKLSVHHSTILYRSALDLSSTFYKDIAGIEVSETAGIPADLKRKAVGLQCRMERAVEEINLVKADMSNVIMYWQEQCSLLQAAFHSCEGGLRLFLQQIIMHTEKHCNHLEMCFSSGEADEPDERSDEDSDSDDLLSIDEDEEPLEFED